MKVMRSLMSPAFSRGSDHFHNLLPCLLQYSIAVIGSICKKLVSRQIGKQFSGGHRIVYVARREKNTQRISRGVNNSMDVTRRSAPCASASLSKLSPSAGQKGTLKAGANPGPMVKLTIICPIRRVSNP